MIYSCPEKSVPIYVTASALREAAFCCEGLLTALAYGATEQRRKLRFSSATERAEKIEVLCGFPQRSLRSLWQEMNGAKP